MLQFEHVADLAMVDLPNQMKSAPHIEGLAVGDARMAPDQHIHASGLADHEGVEMIPLGQFPNVTEDCDLMFVVGFRVAQQIRDRERAKPSTIKANAIFQYRRI
jgi:hypothetical protein